MSHDPAVKRGSTRLVGPIEGGERLCWTVPPCPASAAGVPRRGSTRLVGPIEGGERSCWSVPPCPASAAGMPLIAPARTGHDSVMEAQKQVSDFDYSVSRDRWKFMCSFRRNSENVPKVYPFGTNWSRLKKKPPNLVAWNVGGSTRWAHWRASTSRSRRSGRPTPADGGGRLIDPGSALMFNEVLLPNALVPDSV